MWTIFEETKREGREEGLIEGREKGLIEGKKEMIFTMLEAGYACEEVARISGMTESEIRKMEKESEYCWKEYKEQNNHSNGIILRSVSERSGTGHTEKLKGI